ncbi:hypothetical protein NHX12_019500, partial [Muraenolepis orangiensis]
MLLLTRSVLLLLVTGLAKGSECNAGCNAENGLCVPPGECRYASLFPGALLCQRHLCGDGRRGVPLHVPQWVCGRSLSPEERTLPNQRNGGTCMDSEGEAAYASCVCPAGFAGDFCEISVDSCAPNPCLNHGRCTSRGPAFACDCTLGFSG